MINLLITTAIIVVGGILAAASLIVARKPNAKDLIDKLTPYQGWTGVVMAFWGVWGIINSLRFLSVLSAAPITWIFALSASVIMLAVGFLLGFGLLTKWTLSGSPAAQLRGQQLRAKLAPMQGTLGILAIAVGLINFIWVLALA
jgi:hypothetical protein